MRDSDLKDNSTVISLDQAYENSRGNNMFYTLNVFCIIMSYSFAGILPYSIPFLVKQPDLLCQRNSDGGWVDGSRDDACSGQFLDFKINYESNETITNWITSLHLIGVEDYKIGMFGSLYFIGFFIGSAFLLRLADIKGRRKIAMIGIIGTVLCGFTLFVTNNLMLTYFCMLVLGIFVSIRVLVSYLYALELVATKKKKTWNLVAALSDAIIMIIVAFYFYIIKYGESTIVFYMVFSLISLYFVYRAPESPRFLYSKENWEGLHSAFSKISRINNKEWDGFKFDKEGKIMNEFNIKSSCSSMVKDK